MYPQSYCTYGGNEGHECTGCGDCDSTQPEQSYGSDY